MPADTPTGFDRAPDRYSAKGRETIDRMRDEAHVVADRFLAMRPWLAAGVTREELADLLFAYHCDATAMKYDDREGLKDDPAQDRKKQAWYRLMGAHARGEGDDPRSGRVGFVSYVRPSAVSGV